MYVLPVSPEYLPVSAVCSTASSLHRFASGFLTLYTFLLLKKFCRTFLLPFLCTVSHFLTPVSSFRACRIPRWLPANDMHPLYNPPLTVFLHQNTISFPMQNRLTHQSLLQLFIPDYKDLVIPIPIQACSSEWYQLYPLFLNFPQ